MSNFSEQARLAMRDQGLSIRAASRALSYDHAFLSRVLNGRQRPSTKLAEALDDLVGAGGSLAALAVPSQPVSSKHGASLVLPQAVNFDELAQVVVMWMQQFNPSVSRRDLLSKLSATFALAAIEPLFDAYGADERQRVTQTIADPATFDEASLRYCENMINGLRRQGDVVGPELTLQSAVGHWHIAEGLAKTAPSVFRRRAVSAYAELTQLIGWLRFNMGDYKAAQSCYDEARNAAHDAENVELVTYVLCTMSHLATWQGKPRVGIDHAAAAAVWAKQANSPRAEAYAADVAVRAYVAARQADSCRETLDQEYAALQRVDQETPASSWWYFYDESFYWRTEGEWALGLGRHETAVDAFDKSLSLVDAANLHNYAFRLLFRAEARIQQESIEEAATIMGDVATLANPHASQRIIQRIGNLRGQLAKWDDTKPVRALDRQLSDYRLAIGSGSTKRTYSL